MTNQVFWPKLCISLPVEPEEARPKHRLTEPQSEISELESICDEEVHLCTSGEEVQLGMHPPPEPPRSFALNFSKVVILY